MVWKKKSFIITKNIFSLNWWFFIGKFFVENLGDCVVILIPEFSYDYSQTAEI